MKNKLQPPQDMTAAKDLFIAAWQGDLEMVKKFYGTGANIGLLKSDVLDIPALNVDADTTGFYRLLNRQGLNERLNVALQVAALRGHADVVDFFLQKEAYNPRTLDVAFYGAALGGDLALVKKLESAGAHMSFDGHISLIDSIREKNYAVTAHILQNGKGHAEALVAYIEAGDIHSAEDIMYEDIDVLAATKAICRQLSDKRDSTQKPPNVPDERYLHLLDYILSFAEGLGEGVPAILRGTLAEASTQAATAVTNRLLDHDAFKTLPDRQALLDNTLTATADAFVAGLGSQRSTSFYDLCTRLMEQGANPDIGLQAAAKATAPTLAKQAIALGADPRANGYAALNAVRGLESFKSGTLPPAAAQLLAVLETEEKRLDVEDFLVFKGADAPLTENLLRSIDRVTGRSGLDLAVAAGEGKAALTLLKGSITAEELLESRNGAPSLIDRFCRNGQAELLQDASLWALREDSYAAVFDAFPVQQKQALAAQHEGVLESLKAARDTDNLRRLRGEDKNRFRPK